MELIVGGIVFGYDSLSIPVVEYNFNTSKEEIESFINSNIRSTAQYLENIREITTGGKYMVAEDGTRVTIQPGTTRTYVIYTKI